MLKAQTMLNASWSRDANINDEGGAGDVLIGDEMGLCSNGSLDKLGLRFVYCVRSRSYTQ